MSARLFWQMTAIAVAGGALTSALLGWDLTGFLITPIMVCSALVFIGLDWLTRHVPRLSHLRGAFDLQRRPLARVVWAGTVLMASTVAAGSGWDVATLVRTAISVLAGGLFVLWMTRHVPKAYRQPARIGPAPTDPQ